MNMVDCVTDCDKRVGLWQLSHRERMRAFDNVASLHLLIAKLLLHFHHFPDHYYIFMRESIFFFFLHSQKSLTHLQDNPWCKTRHVINQLKECTDNTRPITLLHLHMVRNNLNCFILQWCQLLPSTTCHQDILQQNQRKHLRDCVSRVLSSVSLN